MADSILTVFLDHPKKALHVLGLLSILLLLMQEADATEFKVGGADGWSVPADAAPTYNQWAERNRFKIGDSLRKSSHHSMTTRFQPNGVPKLNPSLWWPFDIP